MEGARRATGVRLPPWTSGRRGERRRRQQAPFPLVQQPQLVERKPDAPAPLADFLQPDPLSVEPLAHKHLLPSPADHSIHHPPRRRPLRVLRLLDARGVGSRRRTIAFPRRLIDCGQEWEVTHLHFCEIETPGAEPILVWPQPPLHPSDRKDFLESGTSTTFSSSLRVIGTVMSWNTRGI